MTTLDFSSCRSSRLSAVKNEVGYQHGNCCREVNNPVFQSRYHLRPRARPPPSNRSHAGTQPRFVAALSQLLRQEEKSNFFIDPASGQSLEYRHLIRGPDGATWVKALANNLGRLSQGVGTRMPTSTNTVLFVSKVFIHSDRKVNYARMVATI